MFSFRIYKVIIIITNIVSDIESNTNVAVKYLDLSMLNNLKIKDNRTFKLGIDISNKIFNNNNNEINTTSITTNNSDELVKENELLKQKIEELNKKIELIKDIVN